MQLKDKIYISGHLGLVGSAIERKLKANGHINIVSRSSKELDLRNQSAVNDFFELEKPTIVINVAGKVGGIHANNTYRAEFIYDNLMIQANVLHAAYMNNATKLLYLGSSCIYPKLAPQPLKEEYILSSSLEPTNQPYAIAKIAGIELCDSYRAQYGCNYISAMPTNLYGTNDNYHPENSHVLPALIRRIILAHKNNEPTVTIWGTGTPRREFMHVDDLADACFFLLQNYNEARIKGMESIIKKRVENENWKMARMFIEHFQMKNGYINYTKISNELNINGYKTRMGFNFSPSIVRRLVK